MMGIVSSDVMTAAQQPSHDQTVLTVDLVGGWKNGSFNLQQFRPRQTRLVSGTAPPGALQLWKSKN
jgi:hypothetical protein